jgi:coenzyme F420-0:L-glutamate ligase / coenzyme F420-1:gamma-L-glutamate ligase
MEKDDLHAFLRSRRSIRRFQSDPVPHDCIQRVLETAIYAPSAHNLQPWRFAVITGSAAKKSLAKAITARFRQDMLADGTPEEEIQARIKRTVRRTVAAPVIVILCRDTNVIKAESSVLGRQDEVLMATQSVALAGLQLLLAAHAEGLGGTWICWPLFAPDETRTALGLSAAWEPQGMLFLGYPYEHPEPPIRPSQEDITLWI